MTRAVAYTIYASAVTAGVVSNLGALDAALVVSLDMDRAPFAAARLTLRDPSDLAQSRLDPRRSPGVVLQLRAVQTGDGGSAISYLPGSTLPTPDPDAMTALYVQGTEWDEITRELVVEAIGYESRLMEMVNLTTTSINTTAATLGHLVDYALTRTPGTPNVFSDPLDAFGRSIPAGDRVTIGPGQSYWDFIESEASEIGARLYADLTGQWALADRDDPPRPITPTPQPVTGSTFELDDAGFPVTGLKRSLRRDTDWADGVLTKHTYTSLSGATVTEYRRQTTSTSGYSKGLVVDFGRPATSASLAERIRARSLARGSSYTVTGRIDFRAVPGRQLRVRTPGEVLNLGIIRSVEWDLTTGEMTLATQIGQPVS